MLNITYKSLIEAKQKYDAEIKLIEQKLRPRIRFDFFIMYQPSDGFVIVDIEGYHNAPLSQCVAIINRKRQLTYKNYLHIRI